MKGSASIALVAADVVALLKTDGFITAAEEFDDTKFANVSADAALAAGVESILKAHGVTVPGNVDRVIQLLPLLAGFVR